MSQVLYILTLSLLITHELDAIARHEWRIFPFLNKLKDGFGYFIFIALHIPLFITIFWLSWHSNLAISEPFQIGVAIFCIIHIALHIILRNHPKNEFNNPLSQFLIWSCGAAGAMYLIGVFFLV